jgi:ceramide glucosyltransferase
MLGAAAIAAIFSGLGLAQGAAGLVALERFIDAPTITAPDLPPISVLKPLHGEEPALEAALDSFLAQDYPDFQVVFGIQNPADPALAVVERLRRRFPERDIALVVDATQHGRNRKVGIRRCSISGSSSLGLRS